MAQFDRAPLYLKQLEGNGVQLQLTYKEQRTGLMAVVTPSETQVLTKSFNVSEWLLSLGLYHHTKLFESQELTSVQALVLVNETDLASLGVPIVFFTCKLFLLLKGFLLALER